MGHPRNRSADKNCDAFKQSRVYVRCECNEMQWRVESGECNAASKTAMQRLCHCTKVWLAATNARHNILQKLLHSTQANERQSVCAFVCECVSLKIVLSVADFVTVSVCLFVALYVR